MTIALLVAVVVGFVLGRVPCDLTLRYKQWRVRRHLARHVGATNHFGLRSWE